MFVKHIFIFGENIFKLFGCAAVYFRYYLPMTNTTIPQTREEAARAFLVDIKAVLIKHDAVIEVCYDDYGKFSIDVEVNYSRYCEITPYTNFTIQGQYIDKDSIDKIKQIF